MSAHGRAAGVACRRFGGRWRLCLELVLYNLVLSALVPVLGVWILWRAVVQRKPMGSWRHRLGLVPRLPQAAQPRIWLHAVSAGEMAAAKPVLDAARRKFPDGPIAVSAVTAAGMTLAERDLAAADACFYLPFDLPECVFLSLRRVRPALLVVLEKELWPNLLGLARLSGARVLVVNGRVSDRMMRRARWVPGLVRWLYRLPDCFCVQSREDARRLAELGVEGVRIVVAGNTKVDTLAERDVRGESRLVEDLGVTSGQSWFVAGSTHPGEEEAVAEAFGLIGAQLAGARLLLAPRHLHRVAAVSAKLAEQGRSVVRRSETGTGSDDAIVVLDTMGELRAAYAFATAAFVGGTLVPIGGHNLLEPVAAGRPVLFGPHTESCADVADLVCEHGVGFRVNTAQELADHFMRIARDGALREQIAAAGRRLIEQQRGAAARCAEVAFSFLWEHRTP
jgi:3-deoxy-D-manno-octulosonic-acid transferase